MIKSILFFGNYPNPVDRNLNVFYRDLIYQIADMGIQCTVVDPVSITKYKGSVSTIPTERIEKTVKGSEVRVISPRYISFSSKKIGCVDTHIWTVRAYRRTAIKQVKRYKLDFDITYGHFINIGGIPACVVGKKFNKRSFVANGESDLNPNTYNYNSGYGLKPFRFCSGVISVSTKNRDELSSLNLIDESLIKVIPNAIDHRLFYKMDKNKCRKQMNLPMDTLIAGFVGSYSERKGHRRVLEATKNIKGLKVAFVGSGSDIPKDRHVIFCEKLDHDIIPVFLNACDFFVLPTLNEGCCNAIIEAMGCGLPIISSNLSFNDDILDETNSIRIDPTSIEQIRKAVLTLVSDSNLRERLSAGALKTASYHSLERRARMILDFLED